MTDRTKYNFMQLFNADQEQEAREFAEKVNGTYGWMKDIKTDEITEWYVEYNNTEIK